MLWSSINCKAISRNSINGDTPYNFPLWCPIKQLFLSPADKLDGPSIWFYKAVCLFLSAKEIFMRPVMEKSLQVTDYCIVKSDTSFLQDLACWVFLLLFFFLSPLISDSCSLLTAHCREQGPHVIWHCWTRHYELVWAHGRIKPH